MLKKLSHVIKSFIKPLLTGALVLSLVLSQAQGAWAASGGRMGGGSFRMPSRSMPSRSYAPPGGGGYYPGGGGFGMPFLIPSIGIGLGGSGLLSLLVFMAVAGFLVNTFRSMQSEGGAGGGYEANPTVSVAKLQVGLLSDARSLQTDLNRIAEIADTGTKAGLTQVLQETTLSLLRHPEYWIYAADQSQVTSLNAAEGQFNQLAIAERSKFSGETLSNVNNLLKHNESGQALPSSGELATLDKEPGAYIVVTLLVATQGKLQLPAINSSQDLRQAISQIGSVSGENLLALEVLWTPQADGDTLSADDVLSYYPELKLV